MQRVGKDLWTVRKDFRLPGLGNIGGCATVAQCGPGELAIISPVNFSPTDLQAIRACGEVRFLISPNPLHHLYLPAAKIEFAGHSLTSEGKFCLHLVVNKR